MRCLLTFDNMSDSGAQRLYVQQTQSLDDQYVESAIKSQKYSLQISPSVKGVYSLIFTLV